MCSGKCYTILKPTEAKKIKKGEQTMGLMTNNNISAINALAETLTAGNFGVVNLVCSECINIIKSFSCDEESFNYITEILNQNKLELCKMHDGITPFSFYLDDDDDDENILNIFQNGFCKKCEIVFADEIKDRVDTLLQNRVYSHGLLAFREKNAKNLEFFCGFAPKWQICCSDRTENIGPIGVFVRGNVLVASTVDLWSEKAENGRRFWRSDSWRAGNLVFDLQNFAQKEWDHKEVILKNAEIVGVWVKKWADDSIKKTAKKIAEKLGVKLFEVSARKK